MAKANESALGLDIDNVPIELIVVGERRRKKMGNIASLAKSIEARGLLHPIVIRNGNELVAGQRRLEACKRLGWKKIPVRRFESLSDEELRAVELEENTQRLDLENWEQSAERLAELRREDALRREGVSVKNLDRKAGPGRPKGRVRGSMRALAEVGGISQEAVRHIEEHVRLGEEYPVFQRPVWKKHQVLEAGELLEQLPEKDRPIVAAMVDRDFTPPSTVIPVLQNLATMPADRRKDILAMAQAPDEAVRDKALTTAAKLPPPLDPRHLDMMEVVRLLKRCLKAHADHHTEEIERLLADAKRIEQALGADYKREKERLLS